MNIAFHQNTQQQPIPQPQDVEENVGAEQSESFVDSFQSSVGLDISPLFLIGAFVLVVVLIGLLVKFSKPKQDIEDEASTNDASNEQTVLKDETVPSKPLKSKKKQTRRQRKKQK